MSDWNVAIGTKVETCICWFYILFSLSARPKKNASSFKLTAA